MKAREERKSQGQQERSEANDKIQRMLEEIAEQNNQIASLKTNAYAKFNATNRRDDKSRGAPGNDQSKSPSPELDEVSIPSLNDN